MLKVLKQLRQFFVESYLNSLAITINNNLGVVTVRVYIFTVTNCSFFLVELLVLQWKSRCVSYTVYLFVDSV